MNTIFNTEAFIKEKIIHRQESFFKNDLEKFKNDLEKEIKNKSVLVIGGAGTIGSSFIKALLAYSPGKLVVIDINENGLTELVRDCRSSSTIKLPEYFKFYPLNFGSGIFKKIFETEAPFNIVANFAAHKHVRSEKDVFSIEAMIENNVLHAKSLLDVLVQQPPQHFFCVSTDKAANPVNIMGASKKLMEEVVLAYSNDFTITTARFANVAFSNGSLLAGFLERVMKQQPLSCPSDVKRFFVSPQEAGELCLLACVLGKSGDIFFPRLSEDEMVNFSDIAVGFIKELGFEPEICITENEAREKVYLIKEKKYPVYFFASETSGEKLYEEFYTADEELDLDKFSCLGVIKNAERKDKATLNNIIRQVEALFSLKAGKQDVIALLHKLLPGFKHIETGMNLDQKM
ncbi:polysaccharide biosynthesis protein [Parafilimonas sp.]|uniref:polysaccharide biosynthesis protein n=1 Tax=Parafilimonas sp. TaxID=1969739 RepID=UPI0039E717F3